MRWSGIEKYKYNLTARWYISAQYGNDYDVDGVGLYEPTTNPNGHGGKTRPFASIDKLIQENAVVGGHVVVFDSGNYSSLVYLLKALIIVGDGQTNLFALSTSIGSYAYIYYYNVNILNSLTGNYLHIFAIDSKLINCTINAVYASLDATNCILINCIINRLSPINCTVINCTAQLSNSNDNKAKRNYNNIFISDLTFFEPAGSDIINYNLIIGSLKSNIAINGKTSGVTVEDFKIDGRFNTKSISEKELWGNPSGSGATTAQLQTIFNNYFYPILPDDLPFLDLTLKPLVNKKILYGGLNGYYIGSLPVGYSFTANTLWGKQDEDFTSGLEWDGEGITLSNNVTVGTYRSTMLSFNKSVQLDAVQFMANAVFNDYGVAINVADYTPQETPDNTKNQRSVYDYRLKYSSAINTPLNDFKVFEINNIPYIDNDGNSALSEAYNDGDRNRITVYDFIIEFTIRKI